MRHESVYTLCFSVMVTADFANKGDASALISSLLQLSDTELKNGMQDILKRLGEIYSGPQTEKSFFDGSTDASRVTRVIFAAAVDDVPKNLSVIRGILSDLAKHFGHKYLASPGGDLLGQLDDMYFKTFKDKTPEDMKKLLREDFDYALTKLDTTEYFRFMISSADSSFKNIYSPFSGQALFTQLRALFDVKPQMVNWEQVWPAIENAPFDFVVKFFATRKHDDPRWPGLLKELGTAHASRTAAARVAVAAIKVKNTDIVNKHYEHPEFARALAEFDGTENTTAQLLKAEKSCEPYFRAWQAIYSILPEETAGLFMESLKEPGAPHRLHYFVVNDFNNAIRKGWIEFFLKQDDAFITKYLAEQYAARDYAVSPYGTLTDAFLKARYGFPQYRDSILKVLPRIAQEDAPFATLILDNMHFGSPVREEQAGFVKLFLTHSTQTVEVFTKYRDLFESRWKEIKLLFTPNMPPLPPSGSCPVKDTTFSVESGKCQCKVNMTHTAEGCMCAIGFEARDGECKPCGKNTKSTTPGVCECTDSSMEQLPSGDCQVKPPACTGLHMIKTVEGCFCEATFRMTGGECIAIEAPVAESPWVMRHPVTTLGLMGAGALALTRLNRANKSQLPLKTVQQEASTVKSGAWKWLIALVFLLIAILAVVIARYWSRLTN